MVKKKRYDLILMDHMMPEMDGIEATAHIRSECGENGTAPIIIALSANAYNNAREMFLNNGFQDFISKPLDRDELHKLLLKWIPKERRQPMEGTQQAADKREAAEAAELFMTGVDADAILKKHTGGVEDYIDLLELYYMDGQEKCELIERLAKEQDYKNYEIEVHALKSASANVGAFELSDLAKEQEFAAKEQRFGQIESGVGRLLSEYRFILHEMEGVLRTKGRIKPEEETNSGAAYDPIETERRMREILDDIENFRSKPAAQKTEALLTENIEKSARDCLKDVKNRLKMYDDDSAEDLLRAFLGDSPVT
jgi:CheY-like chemotaxis protein